MKTMYIKPEIFATASTIEHHLCAGSPLLGVRKADWGAKGVNDYSNSAWDNQGWGDTETPVIAGNDNGVLNSQTNGNGLWEDED